MICIKKMHIKLRETKHPANLNDVRRNILCIILLCEERKYNCCMEMVSSRNALMGLIFFAQTL